MRVWTEYPGLLQELTPAGNTRWRVRVEGDKSRRITIPVGPGHPVFKDHYDAARLGIRLEAQIPAKVTRGTFDELCERYNAAMVDMVTAGDLNEDTRTGRLRGLRQAADVKMRGRRMGELNADFPEEAFVHILDSFGSHTGAAETCLKAMKAAYRWGKSRGFPKKSEVFEVSSPHKGRGGAMAWTEVEEKKFLETHGSGTMARRWFYLTKNMAGRIGDTFDIGPESIKLKQGRAFLGWQPKKKGSKYVEVPLMKELAEELELGVHEDAFLLTEFGGPFASKNSLGNKISKWVVQAGFYKNIEVVDNKTGKKRTEKRATRSQHGVRKATGHEMALSGANVYEIAAHLSHSDFKSSAPYVQGVDRARLVESGFDRVERARQGRSVPRHENRGTPEGSDANE